MTCHEIETRQYDTSGQPIREWKCYCGTTACLENKIQNYHSIELETVMSKKEFERETCDKCGIPHWKK